MARDIITRDLFTKGTCFKSLAVGLSLAVITASTLLNAGSLSAELREPLHTHSTGSHISPECQYAMSRLSEAIFYLKYFCDRHGYRSDVCLGMQGVLNDAWRAFCAQCSAQEVPFARECEVRGRVHASQSSF